MLAVNPGHVTGRDASARMVELARGLAVGQPRSGDLDYVVADVLDATRVGTFDLVACAS